MADLDRRIGAELPMMAGEQVPLSVGLAAPYLEVYEAWSPLENLAFLARARGEDAWEGKAAALLERAAITRWKISWAGIAPRPKVIQPAI